MAEAGGARSEKPVTQVAAKERPRRQNSSRSLI